mgnify:CR=1 FL=1
MHPVHHGRDFVAFLEHVARVFHAVAADLGGTQVAQDVLAQVDLGALGLPFAHVGEDAADKTVSGAKKVGAEAADKAEDVGDKAASGAKKAGSATVKGAKKAGSAVKDAVTP